MVLAGEHAAAGQVIDEGARVTPRNVDAFTRAVLVVPRIQRLQDFTGIGEAAGG